MLWNKHIDQITSKGNKRLGFIKRNLKIPNKALKEKAYKSLIRPTVEYASTVWDPASLQASTQIEMIQRRSARWVLGNYNPQASVTAMLTDLKWRTLALRRVDARLCMFYKIIHGLVKLPPSNYFRLQRDGIHVHPMTVKPEYYQFSFFPRTANDWCTLDTNVIKATSLNMFRNQISQINHPLPYLA